MVLENIITTPTVLKDKDNEKQQPLHETSRWSQAYHDSSTKMSKMSLVEAEVCWFFKTQFINYLFFS